MAGRGRKNTPGRASASVEAALAYDFEDATLLERALTHPSLENRPNYQRLEFLGDRVLGLAIAAALYRRFPGEREGRLSRKLTNLVRRETLARVAEDIGLGPWIHLAGTAEVGGGRENPAVLADVLEALIGAVYLEAGYAAAEHVVLRLWDALLEDGDLAEKDAKSALQEWAQARGMEPPTYRLVERTGPDHDPTFRIAADIEGRGHAEGSGPSKRVAEQEAAALLLARLQGQVEA